MDQAAQNESDAAAPNVCLSVSLFGPLVVRLGDSDLPAPRSQRGKWLLALLVLRRDMDVDRRWLAGTLWPESDDLLSLANLRRTLTDLRTCLGSQAWRIVSNSRNTLRLVSHGCSLDIAEFDAGIKLGNELALQNSVNLYRGPLLEGCSEEWILVEREVRSQNYLDALETLADICAARTEFGAAVNHLRRVVTAEPLRECAQRSLIKALAGCGDYPAALQTYRDLRLLLRRQLNTDPDPETRLVFEEMQANIRRVALPNQVPHVPVGQIPFAAAHIPIPFPVSLIIGRDTELNEIGRRMVHARLLTLTGAGGVGKTRLAIEAANRLAPQFASGAAFVELASVNDAESVLGAAAAALGIEANSGQTQISSICNALQYSEILLVVDNCEHLLSTIAGVTEALLIRCPNLRVIATSRQSLGISGEVVFSVVPLSLPPEPAEPHDRPISPADALRYDAVRMFVERSAVGINANTLTSEGATSVAAICRKLDGIPLALELAAARTRHFDLQEIEARLSKALPLLASNARTVSPRQRTLTAALDWSFDLLDADEKRLLTELSVFAGSFEIDAVSEICSGTLSGTVESTVLMLVDKSLVNRDPSAGRTRYSLLQVTREYLTDKLRESGELDEMNRRHAEYFLGLAADVSGAWKSNPTLALQLIDINERELISVLDWCIHSPLAYSYSDRVLRMARMLAVHCGNRGRWVSAQRWVDDLLCRLTERTEHRANALLRSAALAATRNEFVAAMAPAEEALSIFRELQQPTGAARALNSLGKAAVCRDRPADAFAFLEEALAIYREVGTVSGSVSVHTNKGLAYYGLGDYRSSITCHELCLQIAEEQGSEIGKAWAMDNLGDSFLAAGENESARQYYKLALPIFASMRHFVGVSECVRGLAQVVVTMHRIQLYSSASALLGAAETMRFGAEPVMPMFRRGYENAIEHLTNELGTSAFEAQWRRGRSMEMDAALDESSRL